MLSVFDSLVGHGKFVSSEILYNLAIFFRILGVFSRFHE